MTSSADIVRLTVTRLREYELVEGELGPSIDDEIESGERLLDVEGTPLAAAAEAAAQAEAAGYNLGMNTFEMVLNGELPKFLTVITSVGNLLVTATSPGYHLPSPAPARNESRRVQTPGHRTMGDRPSDSSRLGHSAG